MQQQDRSVDSLSRRTFVAGAIAANLALAANPSSAQRLPTSPRPKGPLIWRDMDQQDLDEAYDQAVYAFNRDNIFERGREANERALAKIGAPRRVNYGPREIEQNLIFRTERRGAPTLIFSMAVPGTVVARHPLRSPRFM